MIEDFWKDKYPAGIAADINPDEYPNIQAVLKQSCQRFANNHVFIGRCFKLFDELFIGFTRAVIFNTSNLIFMLVLLFI